MTAEPAARGVICLAVFKPDRELLARQLDSIKAQSLDRWTCIVGIDGDDPATEAVVRTLVADDARFVVHAYADNVGFYLNFERLLDAVDRSTSWVALSDQDDVWYPEKLATLVGLLDTTVLATGSARLVDAAGTELGVTRRINHGLTALMLDNQITGSMSVFRTDLLQYALPFPPATDVAYHDHWLGIVASGVGDVVIDSRILQDYVQHGSNVIGEERRDAAVQERAGRLAASGGPGITGALRYLAVHRWGWRVSMARLAIERIPEMQADALTALEPFARGSLSARLVRDAVRALARKQVPGGRTFALVAGAAASRPSDVE